MKLINLWMLISILFMLTISCDDAPATEEEIADTEEIVEEEAPIEEEVVEEPMTVDPMVKLELMFEEDEMNPKTITVLWIDEKSYTIGELPGEASLLSADDYEGKGIPSDAIAAASGWWAGGGRNVYVAIVDGDVKAYERFEEEMVGTDEYKWQETPLKS